MHLLVLGATGPSGLVFVEEALRVGHRVTAYVRNASKLPETVTSNDNVAIIQGTFDNIETATEALHCGAEALVSFAGPQPPSKGTPVADFYDQLFPSLADSPIRRVMICCTASFSAPSDQSSWKNWLGVNFIRLIGGSAYDEMRGIGRVTTSLPLDKIEWTLFRVPVLTNWAAAPVQTGMIGSGTDGMLLSRSSLAVWIVQELQTGKFIGQTPMVSNAGWI